MSTFSAHTFNGYPPNVAAKCAHQGAAKDMARILRRYGVVMTSVARGAIRVGGKYLARLAEEDPVAFSHRLILRLVASDIPIEVAACGDLGFAYDTTHARQSMG